MLYLTIKVMTLRARAFRKSLGVGGRTLINGIRALIKEAQRS
jgi:hypothetical protein